MHLSLEKFPEWKIGHIDPELYTVQRCFEVTRQDVYSFLTTDVAQAFQCIFDFDTIHHRIHVYQENSMGEDTNIFVSYHKLLKNTNISSSIDDIKTCLTFLGADDLNLREVNDRIYNLDYFHDLDYMSKGLYDAYTLWAKKWKDKVTPYENLVTQYQSYYNQIHFLQSEKMPDHPESTNWSEYGLNPLKEKLASYEQKQSVMIKLGQGESTHKDYQTLYLPCYHTIQAIKAQIVTVENQIIDLQKAQSHIARQMDSMISSISMQNHFTEQQLDELSKFIREDELSSSNFVVTDTMTDSERMDLLHEMLQFGREELAKVSQPALQFSCNMNNLFVIPEFDLISDQFEVGNYIHICLRDDYIIRARLLEMDLNLYDESDFHVTFGNIAKSKKSKIYEDITKALELSNSVAASVSFHSSNWNQANKTATDLNQMLADGLLSAGQSLNTAKADVQMNDNGLFISNTQESKYSGDRIFIGGGKILFSDDNLKTVRTALGRVQYTKKGITYDDFGLLAQFVISAYVAGSTIEGNEILGGTITGTDFNNGNETFHVDSSGHLFASSAEIKGKIQADSGSLGGAHGFKIQSGKLYSGSKSSFTSANPGVYVGTDGISLGQNSTFRVDSSGTANGTYGNFNNGFAADTSFGLSGGALNHFDTLVCRNITAETIRATNVLSDYVTANTIAANYATIAGLNAANGRIDNLSSSSIHVNRLRAGSVNGHHVDWQAITVCYDVEVEKGTITNTNGSSRSVVTSVTPSYFNAYIMCSKW